MHAQPPHLTYLSRILAHRGSKAKNAVNPRRESDSIVPPASRIESLESLIRGYDEREATNVAGLRVREVVLWSADRAEPAVRTAGTGSSRGRMPILPAAVGTGTE